MHHAALRLSPRRPASHSWLHSGSRSDRGTATRRAFRRYPADRGAVCLHRRAKYHPVEILEQSRRMARDRGVPEGAWLSGHLYRSEDDAWHGTAVEPYSLWRGGSDG